MEPRQQRQTRSHSGSRPMGTRRGWVRLADPARFRSHNREIVWLRGPRLPKLLASTTHATILVSRFPPGPTGVDAVFHLAFQTPLLGFSFLGLELLPVLLDDLRPGAGQSQVLTRFVLVALGLPSTLPSSLLPIRELLGTLRLHDPPRMQPHHVLGCCLPRIETLCLALGLHMDPALVILPLPHGLVPSLLRPTRLIRLLLQLPSAQIHLLLSSLEQRIQGIGLLGGHVDP